MDIPQLKLLAGRVRDLLKHSSRIVGHSQALDLIAALPGLRNWPEVMAFPDRVAACELDATSAGRLAFRLKKNFMMDLTARELLSALAPESHSMSRNAPQVWPSGSAPGVYVTTSPTAISALLTRYEEATDGGLVYAERAGNHWEGSIDLGEYGLWSAGIERLPSGTLLVVGPIELDQSSWSDAAKRLEIACLHALNSHHRVAVLVDTPTPHTLCEDLEVLVRSVPESPDAGTALAGLITEDGELLPRRPFVTGYPKPISVRANVGLEAIPNSTREALRRELAVRTSGIVLFGASEIVDNAAYDQLAVGLAMTEHAGAAARIMARHRSTPAKDWLVPDAIKELPFLPSIETAYAQGYRRMIIDPRYTNEDVLLNHGDVLFFGGTWGNDVAHIVLNVRALSGQKEAELLQRIVAVHGLLQLVGRRGPIVASDLFLRGKLSGPASASFTEFEEFFRTNRVVRWEDELELLLASGAITATAVRKADPRNRDLQEFLTERRNLKKAS